MNDIKEITQKLIDFRNERDWKQFHKPKDLAAALSIEASELLECFLWKSSEEGSEERVREELADVFAYAFLMAEHYGFDVNIKLINFINNFILRDFKVDYTFLNIVNKKNMMNRLGARKSLNRYDKFNVNYIFFNLVSIIDSLGQFNSI